MFKKLITLLLVACLLLLTACGAPGSINAPTKQDESGEPVFSQSSPSNDDVADTTHTAVPDCLKTSFDINSPDYYSNMERYTVSLTRTDNGFSVFCPPWLCQKLLTAIDALHLQDAAEGETPDYALRYPFCAEFTCDNHLHRFEFNKDSILVDGEWQATVTGDKESFSFLYDEQAPVDGLAFELFELDNIMPFQAEDIVRIEYTFEDPQPTDVIAYKTEVYENEQAVRIYELKLKYLTVRKLQDGEIMNPPTGGYIPTYEIQSKDGTTVTVALDWAVFIDGQMEYILLS